MTNDAHDFECDVLVVGGGAAGLSASLVLGRARRHVLVVDGGSPRNAPAAHMQGFLSRDGMPPKELLAIGRDEVRGYGVEIVEGHVASIDDDLVATLTDGRTVAARRVVITTGSLDDLPDIPGLRERWGKDLLHCPYCHGWEVRDQRLGVLGTGPTSPQFALLIRQWSDDVLYFSHHHEVTPDQRDMLDARGVAVIDGEVARLLVADDAIAAVELEDGRNVERDAVFIHPINVARADGLLQQLGCEVDDSGFAIVDENGRTSNPRVWAAGNVVNPRAQVITAAGAASAVAVAVNAHLVNEDVDLAMRRDTSV